MPVIDEAFYKRWVLANGWAESAGLGTTLVLGRMAAPLLEEAEGPGAIITTAVAAILMGVVLEGIVVGVAQERVLGSRLAGLRKGAWVRATAIGAGVAWLVGMAPSTVMALVSQDSAGPEPAELSAAVQYALAVVIGLVTGPILGVAQWTVLRGLVRNPGRWLWANAAAWSAGMLVMFVGMDWVPW